jgi:cytochrome c oxidase subunit 2
MEPRRRLEDWHHMLAMCLVMAAVSGGLAYVFLHVDLIPDPASAERALIDGFMKILFAIAGVFFGVIVTIFAYALLFFRRQPGDDSDARPIRGKTALELTWTIIPLIIVIALSVHAGRILDRMTSRNPEAGARSTVYSLGAFVPGDLAPADTTKELDVDVVASRFIWRFGYPDVGIDTTYELVVPVNRRVVFRIRSEDVIHSFWVQQWGPKQDAVPGLSPVLRITPTKTGRYTVECSQLCGFGHTNMTAPVRVVSQGEFDEWVRGQVSSSGAKAAPPSGSHVMIDLEAKNIAFDRDTITVPAGTEVMIDFNNEDKGVPHNVSVYRTPAAKDRIFSGEIITGPRRITYTFMAPKTPGDYFFRCDVHPTRMTGTFVVK